MGRAGKALKQVLQTYNITQYQLAAAMQTNRATVSRWVNETRDPSAEAAVEIMHGLRKLDPAAAEEFVMLYMYGSQE